MKKLLFSLLAAGSLTFGVSATQADASTYTVKSGDSLYAIATANNISVANLKKWNNLSSTNIRPKQVLKTSGSGTTTKTHTASSKKASNDAAVVQKALKLKGIPYRFGGTTTKGFDCSGFVQYAFTKSGKSISRTTLGQFAQTSKVSSPKPGDLVFFKNTYRKGISHVGIYVGNNKFVHAGGKKSEVQSLSNSYWKTKFHSFKRL